MSKHAVLLLNLGSPDAPTVPAVKRYLKEFLMDGRVIDSNPLMRWLLVNGIIIPRRVKDSTAAYASIWEEGKAAPLIEISNDLHHAVQAKSDLPIFLAMRYGNPSVADVLTKMRAGGFTHIYAIPLYPHYAASSYETAVAAVDAWIEKNAPGIRVDLLPPFFNDPAYIDALAQSAKPYLEKAPFDKLLFSYHGLPRRHLINGDPTKRHCQKHSDCCTTPSPAHATCYRSQCIQTTERLAKALGLNKDQYTVSFQSRLGKEIWLEPYTDATLKALPSQGTKKLLVICPAFVSDCLETIEEIREEGKETFLEAGGETFEQIPCLNTHPAWVDFLTAKIDGWHQWALSCK